MKLLLSDAMELGHTLIAEIHNLFISLPNDPKPCGCAIGSVAAAISKGEELHEFTIMHDFSGVAWLQKCYPWTTTTLNDLNWSIKECYKDLHYLSVASFINYLHSVVRMPRLEIARLIREFEPADSGFDIGEAEKPVVVNAIHTT